MDHRVRDLDQIQERDNEDRGRRIGTILMATASIVGLTFAVGVLVGRAAEPVAPADDPLSKLERSAATAPSPATPAPEAALPKVDAADMTFPATLGEAEERPEVLDALKAAAAEEAALAAPASAAEEPAALPSAGSVTVIKDGETALADDADPQDDTAPTHFATTIPAAVAAGTGARSLPQVVKHDKLVAAAMRGDAVVTSAPHGHDGEYTLQVISYERPEPSRAFAEALRQKGHAAFVASADVPDRGRYYRVRIGPFKNREQAETYRHKFEDDEHMNTFVVRNVPDES